MRTASVAVNEEITSLENKLEVYEVLREMTYDIETWDRENIFIDTLNKLSTEKAKSRKQNKELIVLDNENKHLKEQIKLVRKKSCALRDRFIVDVGNVLRESKNVHDYKCTITDQELQILDADKVAKDFRERIKHLEDEIVQQQRQQLQQQEEADREGEEKLNLTSPSSSSLIQTTTSSSNNLLELDDTLLLTIFSYLDTLDVISAAQICKALYTRVDTLFGMEGGAILSSASADEVEEHVETMKDLQAELLNAAAGSSSSSSNGNSTASSSSSRMMGEIDDLSKKLSGNELQLIISMTEKIKQLSLELEETRAEKEDMGANLQSAETVRDFLVEKLKGTSMRMIHSSK